MHATAAKVYYRFSISLPALPLSSVRTVTINLGISPDAVLPDAQGAQLNIIGGHSLPGVTQTEQIQLGKVVYSLNSVS